MPGLLLDKPEPINPHALVDVNPKPDWLVNPVTVLDFHGELLGPTGSSGLLVQPAVRSDATPVVTETPVDVVAGGAVASTGDVVAADRSLLDRSGLEVTNGLNVIGRGGFTNVESRNLTALAKVGAALRGGLINR